MYNPYEVGHSVYLRHPTEEDVRGKWHEWFSDAETTKYLVDRFWPNSVERQMSFYQSFAKSEDRLVLSIVEKENNEHIGVCNLSVINWVHRYCNLSLIIGEQGRRKGSFAFEAGALLVKIGFLRLNMRNIQAAYASGNKASEKLLQVLHFTPMGRYKDLYFIDGIFQDCVMVMLRQEDWMRRNGFKPGTVENAV